MGDVISLDEFRPTDCLAELSIYRRCDGSILLGVTYMRPDEIASVDTISERFKLVADWLASGLPSLSDQASDFLEEQTNG